MNNQERIALMTKRLTEVLKPSRLEIKDDSHKHIGHVGAKSGGHFTVVISAEKFREQSLIHNHRQIYDALGDLMQTEIHALKIKIV